MRVALSLSMYNKTTIPAFGQAKAYWKQGFCYFSFDVRMDGGGDGGRTRVQKAIHGSIYKFSLSTTFPHTQADKQAG